MLFLDRGRGGDAYPVYLIAKTHYKDCIRSQIAYLNLITIKDIGPKFG